MSRLVGEEHTTRAASEVPKRNARFEVAASSKPAEPERDRNFKLQTSNFSPFLQPMNPKINFTPGPSQLYFTVEGHIRTAFRDGVPSLSHRSKKFEGIYKDTVDGLRALLSIPTNYHVFFTGSATEIWERLIQNLVEENSFHLVNGSFSKRFFEIGQQLNKKPTKSEVDA